MRKRIKKSSNLKMSFTLLALTSYGAYCSQESPVPQAAPAAQTMRQIQDDFVNAITTNDQARLSQLILDHQGNIETIRRAIALQLQPVQRSVFSIAITNTLGDISAARAPLAPAPAITNTLGDISAARAPLAPAPAVASTAQPALKGATRRLNDEAEAMYQQRQQEEFLKKEREQKTAAQALQRQAEEEALNKKRETENIIRTDLKRVFNEDLFSGNSEHIDILLQSFEYWKNSISDGENFEQWLLHLLPENLNLNVFLASYNNVREQLPQIDFLAFLMFNKSFIVVHEGGRYDCLLDQTMLTHFLNQVGNAEINNPVNFFDVGIRVISADEGNREREQILQQLKNWQAYYQKIIGTVDNILSFIDYINLNQDQYYEWLVRERLPQLAEEARDHLDSPQSSLSRQSSQSVDVVFEDGAAPVHLESPQSSGESSEAGNIVFEFDDVASPASARHASPAYEENDGPRSPAALSPEEEVMQARIHQLMNQGVSEEDARAIISAEEDDRPRSPIALSPEEELMQARIRELVNQGFSEEDARAIISAEDN